MKSGNFKLWKWNRTQRLNQPLLWCLWFGKALYVHIYGGGSVPLMLMLPSMKKHYYFQNLKSKQPYSLVAPTEAKMTRKSSFGSSGIHWLNDSSFSWETMATGTSGIRGWFGVTMSYFALSSMSETLQYFGVGRDLDGFPIQPQPQSTNLLPSSIDHLASGATCPGTFYPIKQPHPSLNGSDNCKITILLRRNLFSPGVEIRSFKLHSLDSLLHFGALLSIILLLYSSCPDVGNSNHGPWACFSSG